jgi:hypothetical protein
MVLGGRCLAKLTSEPLPNPSLKPKYLYIAVFCPPLERYVKVTREEKPERYFPKSVQCDDPYLSRFTAGLRIALPRVSVYLQWK